jgi:S-adenosylmethionine-diacylglycerol 3-amino-3-carboxypropyl transferase
MTTVIQTARRAMPLERVAVAGGRASDDKLYFAQVREDARIELAALHPAPTDRVVVVSSGGCTALSLLGAGAAEVHAVDVNRTQNHLVELKAAAVRLLERREAIAFLGGLPMSAVQRLACFVELRPALTYAARRYWREHLRDIKGGILDAGVSERFIGLVAWLIRHVVHRPALVRRMLSCETLDEQRALFHSDWNTRGWRALFAVLLNRWSMSRAYSPEFFVHVGRTNFAGHFLSLAKHALTEVPIADNYFIQKMFTGRYPVGREHGTPPYLSEDGVATIAAGEGTLRLADGSVTDYLRTLADRSVNAFALSNVCEWLDAAGVAELFREVERTAAPDARVVFRNFVGWTELPATGTRLLEDREAGRELIRRDRSGVQSRVELCRVAEDDR